MKLVNVNIPVALLQMKPELYRVRTLFSSGIDGIVSGLAETEERIGLYVQNMYQKWQPNMFMNPTAMIPQEIYRRQRPLAFDQGCVECSFPLNAIAEYRAASGKGALQEVEDCREVLFSVPFPILFDSTDFPGAILVWVPSVDDIFWLKKKDLDIPDTACGLEAVTNARFLQRTQTEIVNLVRRKARGNLKDFLYDCVRVEGIEYMPICTMVMLPESQEIATGVAESKSNHPAGLPYYMVGLRLAGSKFAAVVESETESGSGSGSGSETDLMFDALFQKRPESVLLVGPSGCGKTALWDHFIQTAWRRRPDVQLYTIDPIDFITHDPEDHSWYITQRLEQIVQVAQSEPLIVHIGNLWDLDQVGRGYRQPQSIAEFLAPYLLKGQIRVVAECQPDQLSELENERPQVLAPFTRITVPPASSKALQSIFGAFITKKTGASFEKTIDPQAIVKLENLFRRYSFYSGQPGAGVTFLEQLLIERSVWQAKLYREDQGRFACLDAPGTRSVTDPSVPAHNDRLSLLPASVSDVVRLFSKQTGLPLFLLDESVPFDREQTERFFESRVIGQNGDDGNGAVPAVVKLLETIKAGLSRTNGPIATLLFIGPTGVGKSELAKALAEYLYNDPRRMIRIDMSEFADPLGADRLINGNADGEGILTSQVRMQPFGVVLFDEFEKANPAVFDYLLQILGEGRLSDAKGRLASFQSCVIILTSNLGVESFGQAGIGLRQENVLETAGDHFRSEVSKLVRPELLNRIDRIVPFAPLTEKTLLSILDKDLREAASRPGFRNRNLTLEMDESARQKLIQMSYLPQYGARPLKRALDQFVLVPLSDAMSRYRSRGRLLCRVSVSDSAEAGVSPFVCHISDLDAGTSADVAMKSMFGRPEWLTAFSDIRRRILKLQNSSWICQAHKETVEWKYESKKAQANKHTKKLYRTSGSPEAVIQEKRIRVLEDLLDQVNHLSYEIQMKERALIIDGINDLKAAVPDPEPWRRDVEDLILKAHTLLSVEDRSKVWVYILGNESELIQLYANMYKSIVQKGGGKVDEWKIVHLTDCCLDSSHLNIFQKADFFSYACIFGKGNDSGKVDALKSFYEADETGRPICHITDRWIVGAPVFNGAISAKAAPFVNGNRKSYGTILAISDFPLAAAFGGEAGVHRIGWGQTSRIIAVEVQTDPKVSESPQDMRERIMMGRQEKRNWKFSTKKDFIEGAGECQVSDSGVNVKRFCKSNISSTTEELEGLMRHSLQNIMDCWLEE